MRDGRILNARNLDCYEVLQTGLIGLDGDQFSGRDDGEVNVSSFGGKPKELIQEPVVRRSILRYSGNVTRARTFSHNFLWSWAGCAESISQRRKSCLLGNFSGGSDCIVGKRACKQIVADSSGITHKRGGRLS